MEEKGHFINALPDSGLVTFLAVVRERELRPKKSPGVYLHLLLGDGTGEIEGRVWDGAEEISRLFEADDVVKVRGTRAIQREVAAHCAAHPALPGGGVRRERLLSGFRAPPR